jgi:hypothetical protein
VNVEKYQRNIKEIEESDAKKKSISQIKSY